MDFDDTETRCMLRWFDSIQDISPARLEGGDYSLARRLHETLGVPMPIRPPQEREAPVSEPQTPDARRREVDRQREEIQDATDTRVAIAAAATLLGAGHGHGIDELKALTLEIQAWLREQRKGGTAEAS